ncbi:TorD/DmsD family molecular chaperone [Rhodovulum kholense]|uniref:TorA-specific chaperone n=1 Tax=Rhodovulum kholense TaxID=453584 RepID=A0A8E3AR18_9RHOB|nr:molecular chaperone TorD family protein [Rhodovulum kholense]PTW50452.1 TorA-specific chaperone [Rhodovulum kholense]
MSSFSQRLTAAEMADLAQTAEALASLFLAPPDLETVQALRSMPGQVALGRIGEILGAGSEVDALRQILADGPAEEVVTALGRRHTALFEGIFRQRSLPPYASAWDGTGRLCGPAAGRAQAILRDLDVHLDVTGEPADHLAVQLAALAEALRQDRSDIAARVLDELRWTDRFAAALTGADRTGFYGALARLVLALRTRLAADAAAATDPGPEPLTRAVTAQI